MGSARGGVGRGEGEGVGGRGDLSGGAKRFGQRRVSIDPGFLH